MTELEELQQKLTDEIRSHKFTKIAFQELKNNYAHLELMTEDKPTHIYIQKILAEKAALMREVTELKTKILEIQRSLLPGVSVTGIQRKYDFRGKK